jgi:hypothetical protein
MVLSMTCLVLLTCSLILSLLKTLLSVRVVKRSPGSTLLQLVMLFRLCGAFFQLQETSRYLLAFTNYIRSILILLRIWD